MSLRLTQQLFTTLPRACARGNPAFRAAAGLAAAAPVARSTVSAIANNNAVASCQHYNSARRSFYHSAAQTSSPISGLARTSGGGGSEWNHGSSSTRGFGPITRAILSALVGTSALASAAVWTAPADPAAHKLAATPDEKGNVAAAAALETLPPPPPPGWFRRHLRPELMTLGGALGAFTGFFTAKIGKVVAFVIGGGFVAMQLLAHAGFITVSWSNISASFNKQFNANEYGEVPPSTISLIVRRMLRWLTADVPFTGGFLAGFWLGFRLG
ncbi:FUN14 domain-containing protein 2 [Geranomyces variabilis]|uniref:FUN14 domain-containing protein 2 n=1 Tax=Geranomyces variabilis TaxID=109894 RepID=A0AAD5TLQ1_9FUNG|nr:FUN14 domain-containing protein 2 [Geranomyces variabilis]